jgi:hypothetical protein
MSDTNTCTCCIYAISTDLLIRDGICTTLELMVDGDRGWKTAQGNPGLTWPQKKFDLLL